MHPTTYDGGRDWNAPASPRGADAKALARFVLPNYAEPFARAGRVFAPRYRQASLYATQMTLRDDAREARVFAYADVRRAFDAYLARWGGERPFILAGVEQGGLLVSRLARDVWADPALRPRLIAVYAMETPVPAGRADPPACGSRASFGCAVAYVSAGEGDFTARARLLDRALVWSDDGRMLEDLYGRRTTCVNPLSGADGAAATERSALGAANATGLEWGLRPAFLPHQVAARCEEGVLRLGPQRSPDLKRSGSWTDRMKTRPFNLFWADLEADSVVRVQAWRAARGGMGPSA